MTFMHRTTVINKYVNIKPVDNVNKLVNNSNKRVSDVHNACGKHVRC